MLWHPWLKFKKHYTCTLLVMSRRVARHVAALALLCVVLRLLRVAALVLLCAVLRCGAALPATFSRVLLLRLPALRSAFSRVLPRCLSALLLCFATFLCRRLALPCVVVFLRLLVCPLIATA